MTTGPSFRALDVFEAVVELEGDTRAHAIEAACGDDDALRSEVERMLAVESSTGFLDADAARAVPASIDAAEPAGATIGPFTIVRTLGSGGMGVVYEAEQRVPARRVALKTLATSFGKPNAGRRFHSEIQLLARLDHPAIARVLEAGTHVAAGGVELPYFAMEFVDGARDLVTWGRGRPLRERIALFATVCDAVQHGHQQGVVHRDLKPANVLVDRHDAPKVIDFGVARAVDGTDGALAQATRTGEIVGTLHYMAPEQLDGSDKVDTRTDVYALGLLLYELIAGRAPYDLTDCTLSDVAKVIRESRPLPFDRLTEPVPKDLGWIVLRALEKEPQRRYASASGLADDLRRFLNHVPVEAARPSRTYALKKLIARHKVTSAAVVAVIATVLVGAAVSFTAMLRATDEAEKFRALNGVLTGMFAGVRVQEGGADIRAVELLDRAATEIEEFADRPDLQAALHLTLAKSYQSLSLHEGTEREARRALELAGELTHEERIAAAAHRAAGLNGLDRWGEARELVESWVDDPAFAAASPRARIHLRNLGFDAVLREGAPDRAVAGLRDLLAEAREALGRDVPVTVSIETSLIDALIAAHRYADAASLARERAEAPGSATPDAILAARFLLARAIALQGRHEEARGLLEELVPQIRATFGVGHSRTRVATGGLAAAYLKTGDAARAATMFEELAREWEAREGPEHSETILARSNHARALAELGDARAEEMLLAAFEARERMFGETDARTMSALFEWGRFLRRDGRFDEADEALVDYVARAERSIDSDRAERLRGTAELAKLRLNQGRAAEAAPLFEEAWRGLRRVAGDRDEGTLLIGMNYAGSLIETGRWAEAVEVQIGLLADMRAAFDEDDPRIPALLTNLGGTHAQRGESSLALARFMDALAWTERFLPKDHLRRLVALDTVGTQLVAMGRANEALPHYEELAASSELNPGLAPSDRSAFRLGHARCLSACGRFDAAADEYETVLEMERARVGTNDEPWIERLEEERRGVIARRDS